MTKKDLWKRWADPREWAECHEEYENLDKNAELDQEELDFYDDLDAWHLDKQERELMETKDKLIEHIDRLEENEELTKAWEMDPKDMQEQIQKQLKNLNTILL